MLRLTTLTVLLALAVCTATAETKVLQLSLTPDIALYDRDTVIEGLDLAIWGENEQRSLTLGFIHGSKNDSAGVSIGLVNYSDNYKGAQFGIYNTGNNFSGYSGAIVNIHRGNFTGWQNGAYNRVHGKMTGFQSAYVNVTKEMSGLQLGLVNYAEMMNSGLQIGLVNIIRNNSRYFRDLPGEVAPAMVFVNWKF